MAQLLVCDSGDGAVVIVEQTTKVLPALDLARFRLRSRINNLTIEPLMTALMVVMVQVLFDDTTQLAIVQDDDPIKKLFADGALEALDMGIEIRTSGRQLERLDACRLDDGIESVGVLCITVVDEVVRSEEWTIPTVNHGFGFDLHPVVVRMIGNTCKHNFSGLDLDEQPSDSETASAKRLMSVANVQLSGCRSIRTRYRR